LNKILEWTLKIVGLITAILGFFMIPPRKDDSGLDTPIETQIEDNKKAESEVKRKIEILENKKGANKEDIDTLKKQLEETQKKLNDLEKAKKPATAEEAYD
jgi:uncharacterized membrane protein YgaE (UPF0421/DUF939 family)